MVLPRDGIPSTVGPAAAASPYGRYPWVPDRAHGAGPGVNHHGSHVRPGHVSPRCFGFTRVYHDDFIYRHRPICRPHYRSCFGFTFGLLGGGYPVYEPYPVAVPTPVPVPVPVATPVYSDPGYAAAVPAPVAPVAPADDLAGTYIPEQSTDAYAEQIAPSAEPAPQEQASPTVQPQQLRPQGEDNQAASPADERMAELMSTAVESFSKGQYDAAARTFLQVAMATGDNVDAWLAYAVARFATGDYSMAATAVRRGIPKYPEVVNANFDIRTRYGNEADFERHLMALDRLLRERPDSRDSWLTLGFVLHFSGMRPQATRVFEMITKQFPDDRELADIFLKAKPVPAGSQPDGIEQPGQDEQPADDGLPSFGPEGASEPDARGYGVDGDEPVQSALQAERDLRDAGLTQSGPTIAPQVAYEIPSP